MTVDTVEEHLRVRLNEEEDEVKKVVEAVPCNIQNIFTSVTALTAICPFKMPQFKAPTPPKMNKMY